MNVKKLVVPAWLLGLIGLAAKIGCSACTVFGNGFFLSETVCDGIFAGSFVLILLIGAVLSLTSRRSIVDAKVEKSVGAGLFGIVAAIAMISSGVIALMSQTDYSLLTAVADLAGGGVFLYQSCGLLAGKNNAKKMPLLTLVPVIWCSVRMIVVFIGYSRVAVQTTEKFDLISFALLEMFLFYQAMFLSELNLNTAVRRTMIYGCAFVPCAVGAAVDILMKTNVVIPEGVTDSNLPRPNLSTYLLCAVFLAFAGYALFLMGSICKHMTEEEPEEEEEEEGTPVLSISDASAELADLPNPFQEGEAADRKLFSGSLLTFDDSEEPAPKPEPKPAAPTSKLEPKPAAPAPKPEPKPAAPAPKPEPKPTAPAPKPEPKPAAPASKPEPKPAAPASKPEPKPAVPAPKPEPKPAASAPKPEPKPTAPAPKPEPKPAVSAPKPEPKPAAPAPKPESKPAAPAPTGEPEYTDLYGASSTGYDELMDMLNAMDPTDE